MNTVLSNRLYSRLLAVFLGLASTLPAQADVLLPSTPLQAGSIIPPNVLFVLDDSGSMAWRYMYNSKIASITGPGISSSPTGDNVGSDSSYDSTSTSNSAMYDLSYVTNGLYYNPSVDYLPWNNAAGGNQAATPYSAVYSSDSLASGSTVNLSSNTQTFYIPKPGSAGDSDALAYNRYQILTNGQIYRSELLRYTDVSTDTVLLDQSGQTATKKNWKYYSFSVPAGVSSLDVTTTAGSGNADLYVLRNAKPSNNSYDCKSSSNSNSESCSIASPAAGTWWIGILAKSNFSNLRVTASVSNSIGQAGVGCNETNFSGYDWRKCTQITPTGRTETAERQNFANWYSFYRTRLKTAKGAAAATFSNLGFTPRVGYRTIHDVNNADIPVAIDNGLFEDKAASGGNPAVNNRTNWYSHLFSASASGGTPLRVALDSAGSYFSQTSSSGPYGPEAPGAQISCRQNFSILTTDGYWNESFSIPDQDNTAGSAITGPTPDGNGTRSYTYTPSFPYKASAANTLADVAMKYWKTDLRTDTGMTNNVPTTVADPAFWQHMETFSISIGAQGTLQPTQSVLDQLTAGTIAWPVPASDSIRNIDDLWHSAINGHGKFSIASNSTEFVNGLRSALSAVAERTSSSSNVAANSTRLDTGTQVFQAVFTTGRWTGDLIAYPVTINGTGTSPVWRASEHIPTRTSRNIITWDPASSSGAVFPTTGQTAALGGFDGTEYAAGNQSKEIGNGGSFRDRASVLGDIDHSSPFFVAPASPTAPAMVYVGANDGMLHGFNAATGVEEFAYMPGGISLANLKTQQQPDYLHQYFVDGEISVSTQTQTPGQNILVGSLGRGGKSVYALNVTDPSNFDESSPMWEFSDPDLGNALGKPVIAKMNNGRVAVILGNGYNSVTGRSWLFVIDLQTGSLISKIDTKSGDTTTNSNGLSSPKALDLDRSGTADEVYAGDLLGNMWKFDVSSATPSDWGSAFTSAGKPQPFFVATNASGQRQPITGGLSIGLDPDTFNRWVFFGTGRYLTSGDPGNLQVQSWYGVIDKSVAVADRSNLKQRKIILTTTSNGKTVRGFETAIDGDMAGKGGWYVDLQRESPPTPEGERMITDSILLGDVLVAASIIPSNESCSVGGRGFINAISPFTGGNLENPFFDLNGDGKFDASDKLTDASGNPISAGSVDLGVAMPTMPAYIQGLLVVGGSSGSLSSISVSNPNRAGRISWREIILRN